MSEETIEMPLADYYYYLNAIEIIKNINKCIMSVHRNYIVTDTIPSDYANEIMLNYDDWIYSAKGVHGNDINEFKQELNSLIKQTTEILAKSVFSIPTDHIHANASNAGKVKESEENLHGAIMNLAKPFYENHIKNVQEKFDNFKTKFDL